MAMKKMIRTTSACATWYTERWICTYWFSTSSSDMIKFSLVYVHLVCQSAWCTTFLEHGVIIMTLSDWQKCVVAVLLTQWSPKKNPMLLSVS